MYNETTDILFNEHAAKQGKLAVITLNRPQSLNALSDSMIASLYKQLLLWAKDPQINAVLIRSTGEKAFCAGGDLKQVFNNGPENYKKLIPSFSIEYKLNILINEYPKPYIALLHGIAMGGGLGIALHGTRVIASETLQLAMPETGIGFFPDVGASKFLSQCPYNLGLYLGLTGNTIGTKDAMFCKLINVYVPQDNLENLFNDLLTLDLQHDTLNNIDQLIAQYKQNPGIGSLKEHSEVIEECFGQNSVENIIRALETKDSAWSVEQAAILNKRSPTSLKVTLEQLHRGASMSLRDCMDMEFNIALELFQQTDVYEGIRAAIIDKTFNPKWNPATLAKVNDQQIQAMCQIKCKL
jgi:enoyl-CoA hydratase